MSGINLSERIGNLAKQYGVEYRWMDFKQYRTDEGKRFISELQSGTVSTDLKYKTALIYSDIWGKNLLQVTFKDNKDSQTVQFLPHVHKEVEVGKKIHVGPAQFYDGSSPASLAASGRINTSRESLNRRINAYGGLTRESFFPESVSNKSLIPKKELIYLVQIQKLLGGHGFIEQPIQFHQHQTTGAVKFEAYVKPSNQDERNNLKYHFQDFETNDWQIKRTHHDIGTGRDFNGGRSTFELTYRQTGKQRSFNCYY